MGEISSSDGSIIIPIESRMDDTIISTIINGMNRKNPIINPARNSLITNDELKYMLGYHSDYSVCLKFAKPIKSSRSCSRVFLIINTRRGSIPFSYACFVVISLFNKGCRAVSLIFVKVGAIIKNVTNQSHCRK